MAVILADPYGDLREFVAHAKRIHPRLLCPSTQPATTDTMTTFHIRDTIVEARPMGSWWLDPEQFPACPTAVPPVHKLAVSRRWFVRKQTACATRIARMDATEEDDASAITTMPRDARLWYPSDSARKLLGIALHDIARLFSMQMTAPTLPCNNDSDTGVYALFSTPESTKHAILYKDSIDILSYLCPCLGRLCDEYAHMMCWLYGLTMAEFGDITHMYITRHTAGKTTELLETTDNGRYAGGPFVSVGIGRAHLFHDFNPVLTTSTSTALPVRVKVGEGVLMVMDGYAKTRYAHGHPVTEEKSAYYTLNFQMGCTPRTLCVGIERVTNGMIMYTPFIPEHVVSTRKDTPSAVAIRMSSCAMWSLLMEVHTSLKVAESHLLTRAHRRVTTNTNSLCPAGQGKSPRRQAS